MPSKAAKTPTKKTARKAGTLAASKKSTVASLALDLKSLEKRLKSADTKNRNALIALEAIVDQVKVSATNSTASQKADLARGLDLLEMRVEAYLERAASNARAEVRSEFVDVTSAGADMETLQEAVQGANARLDDWETVQRGALASLNRHLADIATSVDNRLKEETQARKATSAALDTKIDSVRDKLENRFDKVEQETADALQIVGEKITEFATVLEGQAKSSDSDTAERLADLAEETKSELNSVQTDVTSRLEALEMIASAWTPVDTVAVDSNAAANTSDPKIDQMDKTLQSLQEELRRMNTRLSRVPTNTDTVTPTAPDNIVTLPAAVPVMDNPYAAAAQALTISTSESAASNISAKPAQAVQENKKKTLWSRDEAKWSREDPKSHIPTEFNPNFISEQKTVPQMAIPAPIIAPPAPVPPAPVQAISAVALPTLAPPMASSGGHAPSQPEFPGGEPLMPAPLPLSTYDDPAYAEGDDMRAQRIGGNISKGPSLPKLPVSRQNMRVAALAVGVGVVGLFAVKTIFGSSGEGSIQVRNDVPISTQPQQIASQSANVAIPNPSGASSISSATPPLGQYAETQTPNLTQGTQETLDAAVKAGNPIAQFQKGLVQLQTGQMEEGARLIRLAANRNQPAAQYRLAKLYESGTGISKDAITARELIERAASGGNRIAMHDLGNYYAYGQGGLDRDMGEALNWFKKAAERGVVDSQFNVAFLREGNEGVSLDKETALFWYYVAARQGDQGAPDRIAVLENDFDASTLVDIKSRAERFNPKPIDEAANGVFRNVSWNKSASKTASASPKAEILKIRDAQTLLSSLGYEVGEPDGIAGSRTLKAVKLFESVNGLPETGQITDELIRKLEVATGV